MIDGNAQLGDMEFIVLGTLTKPKEGRKEDNTDDDLLEHRSFILLCYVNDNFDA